LPIRHIREMKLRSVPKSLRKGIYYLSGICPKTKNCISGDALFKATYYKNDRLKVISRAFEEVDRDHGNNTL